MPDLRVTGVRLNLHPGALTSPSSPIYRGVARAAGKVRDRAKMNLTNDGNVDTGKLRNELSYEISVHGSVITAKVGSKLPYAWYIHDGTGLSTGGWIYPRRSKVLRFKPKASSRAVSRSGYVYAQRVRGIKGTKFLVRARDSLSPADFAP